jgi:hypothetical protein
MISIEGRPMETSDEKFKKIAAKVREAAEMAKEFGFAGTSVFISRIADEIETPKDDFRPLRGIFTEPDYE